MLIYVGNRILHGRIAKTARGISGSTGIKDKL